MSAAERLAAAHERWLADHTQPSLFVDALITGIDPQLLAAIEDGLALQALREALPEGWMTRVSDYGEPGPYNPGPRYEVSAKLGILSSPPDVIGRGDSLAEAATKAREALEGKGDR